MVDRGAVRSVVVAVLAVGCGSSGAAPVDGGIDASDAGPDAGEQEVGTVVPPASTRHVLLRAGGPAQYEASIAVAGGVVGAALRAGDSDLGPWHLRFGVAPIGPDRTTGAFAFTDLAQEGWQPLVVAGTSAFHVLFRS